MPYTSPADLPPSVRDHIADDHGRRLFMHVFNSVWERGGGEEVAFRQAWAALKRAGWRKGPDGLWRHDGRNAPQR